MADTEIPGGSGPQRRYVDNRGVLLFGFWLAVAVILILVGIWGLFRVLERRQERADRRLEPQVAASLQRTPPEPRLEPHPLAPRRALEVEENARLSTYGWVDRNKGTVHVPIDRAAEIILKTGVPGGKTAPAGTPTPVAAAAQVKP